MFQDLENKDETGEILNFTKQTYYCGPCQLCIATETEYREHIDTHAYDCLYRCLYCSALSPCTSSITDHIGIEHPTKEKYYGCLVFPTTDQILQVLHSSRETPERLSVSEMEDKKQSPNSEGASEKDQVETMTSQTETTKKTEASGERPRSPYIEMDLNILERGMCSDEDIEEPKDTNSKDQDNVDAMSSTSDTEYSESTDMQEEKGESVEHGQSKAQETDKDNSSMMSTSTNDRQKSSPTAASEDEGSSSEDKPVTSPNLTLQDDAGDSSPKSQPSKDKEGTPCESESEDTKPDIVQEQVTKGSKSYSSPEPTAEHTERQSHQSRGLTRDKLTYSLQSDNEDSDGSLNLVLDDESPESSPKRKQKESENHEPTASHLPASPIQLSDHDSDIEITGEIQTLENNKDLQRRATELKRSKTDAFKTSLQCVYSKGKYVCKSCSQVSRNYVQFAQHLYKHLHGPDDKGEHNCPYCPKDTYAILRPLSCSLVTQLMGILQKQKKAQEMARQPPPLQGPFTYSDSVKTPSTPTNTSTKAQKLPHLHPASSTPSDEPPVQGDPSASPIVIEPGAESDEPPTPIVIEPTIETTQLDTPDARVQRRGMSSSSYGSLVSESGTSATSTDESESIGSSTPPISKDGIKGTKYYKGASRVLVHRRLEVTCQYKGNQFVCDRCEYSVNHTKPKVFRRHLWYEVHPSKTCDHCPESVKFNRFMACPVINGIMSGLLEAKEKAGGRQSQEQKKEGEGQLQDEEMQIKADKLISKIKRELSATKDIGMSEDEASDDSLLDVVNADGGNSHPHMQKNKSLEIKSLSLQTQNKSSSEGSKPSDGNISDVIAMIQGLNETTDGESQSQEASKETISQETLIESASTSHKEDNSEEDTGNMFVISSVVSQADDTNDGTKSGIHTNDSAGKYKNSARGEDSPLPQNTDDPQGEAISTDAKEDSKRKADTNSESSNDVDLDDACNKDKDALIENTTHEGLGPSEEKDDSSTSAGPTVSRSLPYSWDKSRKVEKQPPTQSASLQSDSVYTCSFYKCTFWGTRDSAAFKIHNLLHHPGARNFACAYCMRTFATDEYLMQHIDKSHTESRLFIHFRHYHCGFQGCSAAFEREEEFLSHNDIFHSGAESFSCSFCQKEFPFDKELAVHIGESIMYTTTLQQFISRSKYKEILRDVHTAIADRPEPVDSFIQLHLTCASQNSNGKKMFVNINRCVDNYRPPLTGLDVAAEQETFKCTNCSLVTSDEDYFETHVTYCQKYPLLKPRQPSPSSGIPAVLYSNPDKKPTAITNDTEDYQEMQWEEEPTGAFGSAHRKPGRKPGNSDEESDSLPELEPPVLHPVTPPPPPKRKGVLQSLGKGSPVGCGKCTFNTEFRVVKAIHDRVHLYSQDKTKMLWCPHCPYSTDNVLHLKVHVQGHAEKSRIRLYNCSNCPFSSNQLDMVEDHHEDVHDDQELKSEVTRLVLEDLQCFKCPAVLKTEIDLLEHLESLHSQDSVHKYLKEMYSIASLQIVEENEEAKQAQETVKRPSETRPIVQRGLTEAEEDRELGSDRFQCPHCNYSCYKCGSWVRHMQRHNTAGNQEIVMYCCKTCKWKSTSKRKTIDHCKQRHNEIILEVQTMEFSTLRAAPSAGDEIGEDKEEAQGGFAGISRYHCDFCDYSTNEKAVLVEHWKIHEGQTASASMENEEEDDDYEEYTEAYSGTGNQYAQEEIDVNVNGETLELIEDSLLQLQDDERKPTKQPIQCPICPYSTDLRKCMRRHLIFHKKQAGITNGFKCSYCPYTSELEGVVTRHINKHHPDLPVKKIIIGQPKMKDEEQYARDSLNILTKALGNVSDDNKRVFKTPQSCPQCDYTTKLQYNLVQHIRTHSQAEHIGMNRVDTDEEDSTPGFTIAAVIGSDGSTDMVVREGGQVTRHIMNTEKTGSSEDMMDAVTSLGDNALDRDSEEHCQSLFCSKVEGKSLYRCKICVFMDKDPAKIYHHFCTRHKDHCPFRCGYCAYQSVAAVKIQQHCKINHGGLPVKLTNTRESSSPEGMTSPESSTRTVTADLIEDESTLDDECREQAYDDWLSTFMIKCGNNVQMCNVCGYEQKGTAALKRHVLAVHLRYYPYKCKHCAFSAVEANKILKHTDKNHPELERKIIRRKIPDELPTAIDCENTKEQTNVPIEKTEDEFPAMLNVNIKEEPREYSSPEPDGGNEGLSDYDQPSGYSTPDGSNLHLESVRIKKEPEDDYQESPGHSPVKLSRRQKYPKQYVKTYKCTECSYVSKWNLADVKHHVLTVHLKIHSYSCQYCCFGSPKRGKLEEHYSDYHPTLTVNPDETREDIHSALSIIEQGDDVFIGLGENASVIEKRYPANVKPRTPKPPGANVGGRQRSTSPRHSSPAGKSSPHSDHSPASRKRASAGRRTSGTAEQPLDLSYRATPSPMRRTLIPAQKTRVLTSPTTLRVPTITKPYPYSYETSAHARPAKKKKKDYTLYKCSSCGRGYVQKIKAQYHFALKHLNLHPYICNYCSFGEDARKRVVDHITKEHPDKEVVVFPAFREHALVQEKVYPVKVDLSEYEGAMRAVKYINDSGMLHQREKSEKCTVRCPQCSIMLPGLDNLDDHMASTHPDYTGFKCSYCGVYVKAKQKMRYHLTHKHPGFPAKYQPIKEGVPFGNPLSTFDEIVRKKSQFVGQRKPASSGTLTVAFPFYRPKPQKIGFANISKKRLSARCSRGYRENTGNLVEDITLQMRVPTQPTPEEVTVEGRPPPKMIKPRSDVVGGTVWLLCNHCQYTTLTSTLMRHHVMSHINYRPFRCSYCSFNGVRSHQVKKHMISMHRKLPPIVKYRTDTNVEASLTDHFTMKVRRGNASDNQGKPMWMQRGHSHSSVVNQKVNARRAGGEDHVPLKKIKLEKQASEEREEQSPIDGSAGAEVGARRPEEYLCVLCGFRRPSRSSLLRHIMWELDYRPWSCPHCEYKDVTLFGVKRHCFQSHPEAPFKMVLKQNPERMSKIQALVEQSKMNSGSSERSAPSATVVKQDPGDSSEKGMGNEAFGAYPYSTQAGPSHGQNVYEAGMMMAMPSDNTVVTSAEQLEAQEEQFTKDPHIYRCKHCTFQSPDKTCFKKHILRHGPKRFQCGYCSYCAVFKAELHRHMNRLHKRKPYKIISLADNQVVTSKIKTKAVPMPVVQPDFSPAPTLSSQVRTSVGHSVDPKSEGGLLAQLEAELHDMKSEDDSGSDTEPEPAADEPTPSPKRKMKEENGGNQEPFAVLDGVVLTEEHLAMNAAGEYQCQFCSLSSVYREKARTHLAKHFQLRWKCGLCDMKHQLSYEMRRHIRHKHPGMPIKMLRLETDADFVSKTSSPPQLSKDKVFISPSKPNSSYSKPGPACSKKHRPNPSNVPSVFCCFLCTFKTNNTLELVEHQRMHAEAEKMPKLLPEEPIISSADLSFVKKGSKISQIHAPSSSASEASEDLDARSTSAYVRPFKCGYCEFSGFVRARVKKHCLQIHKDKTVYVLDQRPHVRDSMMGEPSVTELEGTSVSVVADDILIMAQPKLEHLLKNNNVKGIRW